MFSQMHKYLIIRYHYSNDRTPGLLNFSYFLDFSNFDTPSYKSRSISRNVLTLRLPPQLSE